MKKRGLSTLGKERTFLDAMSKLWSNNDEVAVIIGLPDSEELITENRIRRELCLPLRVLHKGPTTASVDECMYEPSAYIESIMGSYLRLDQVPSTLSSLSIADYYVLGKVYRQIATSEKGSSKAPTPNVTSESDTKRGSSGDFTSEEEQTADFSRKKITRSWLCSASAKI